MRGDDKQQLDVFSYVSPEQRVPQDHPLRPLRVMTDAALRDLQPRFNRVYAKIRDAAGTVVAAVSVSGPVDRIGRRPGVRWAADLLAAADALQHRL